MNNLQGKLIKQEISEKLINASYQPSVRGENEFLFSNKQLMFEQYKLLVDSAHKIEERRGGSNNIFLGINTLLASFLFRPEQFTGLGKSHTLLLVFMILIGIFISWEWIKVTESYKKLNFINYALLHYFEKFFPTFVFSLRGEIEAAQETEKPTNRANIILIKENLLPKAFLVLYITYLLVTLSYFFFK